MTPSFPSLVSLRATNMLMAMGRTMKLQGISHITRQKAISESFAFCEAIILADIVQSLQC